MDLQYFTDKKLAFALIKKGKILYKSKSQGLKPLIFCVKNYKTQMRGATIYDKVIGRAAALLLVYGRVKEVMTPLINEDAIKTLHKNRIRISYTKKVKHIMNRQGNDLCPMEKLSQSKSSVEFAKIMKA